MGDEWTAFQKTAIRLLVPFVAWIAWLYIAFTCRSISCGSAIFLDVFLIAAHQWANRPMKDALGADFGVANSPTKFLLVPEILATYFFFYDLVHLLEAVRATTR